MHNVCRMPIWPGNGFEKQAGLAGTLDFALDASGADL
jgi:hypothetical protein